MSLPFLRPKTIAGLIVSKRKADGNGIQEEHSEGNEDSGLDACSEDLIRAVHAKDAKAVTAAFKAAWTLLESTETPGDDENTYADQNIKAAAQE